MFVMRTPENRRRGISWVLLEISEFTRQALSEDTTVCGVSMCKGMVCGYTIRHASLGNWTRIAYLGNSQWGGLAGKRSALSEDRAESWADQGGHSTLRKCVLFSLRPHHTPNAASRFVACLSSPPYCKFLGAVFATFSVEPNAGHLVGH